MSRDIVSQSEMEGLLGQSGIDNDTTVILYGDNNNWFAAWAFWQMKYYGHKDVRLMNGGRAKWVSEDRPLTTDVPSPAAKSYSAGAPDESIRAYREQVLSAVQSGNIALVDVRSPAEYSGELLAPENLPQEGSQRGGHIPGAANVPWATAVAEDGTFKSADELADIYGGKRCGRRQGDHRLLPDRRALVTHLVRAEPSPGLRERTQLRRLLDRIRQHRQSPYREIGPQLNRYPQAS